jgi:hypothetical protein
MTMEKGWINRQFARIVRDSQTQPEWMRREIAIRVEGSASGEKVETKRASEPSQAATETSDKLK